MKNQAIRREIAARRGRLGWLFVLTLAVAGSAAAAESLHVLLTNDDGIDAPGIEAIAAALDAADYRYTIVAPRSQQSATSMKVTTGKVGFEQLGPARWAIDGSPADAVAIALDALLVDDRPDLIVSGANFGQNLGSNTNLSGTVGAALMGMQMGVPGIAVSVGMHLAERNAEPQRFASTHAAFDRAAAFTLRLIKHLLSTRVDGAALLPRHTILNVNYPALAADEVKKPVLARVARRGGFVADYVPNAAADEFKVVLRHETRTDPHVARADIELFKAGHITISVLEGNLDATRPAYHGLANRLDRLLGNQRR